jgi:hypothetical protein
MEGDEWLYTWMLYSVLMCMAGVLPAIRLPQVVINASRMQWWDVQPVRLRVYKQRQSLQVFRCTSQFLRLHEWPVN